MAWEGSVRKKSIVIIIVVVIIIMIIIIVVVIVIVIVMIMIIMIVNISAGIRKGTNGVSTNGVTANFMFFDRGTFWVLPLTYFYLPKSARAYLFYPICQNSLLLQRPH